MYSLEAMATKGQNIGSDVQDWFDEEEARTPGFISKMDEANLREATADRLKKLREDAGLTQAQLAARLGVKQPVVARVESGNVMPDLRTVHRYAHALGFLVDAPTFRPMPGRKQPSVGRALSSGRSRLHSKVVRQQRSKPKAG
jgi:transcriptional regulator with XRE-family HTH domain